MTCDVIRSGSQLDCNFFARWRGTRILVSATFQCRIDGVAKTHRVASMLDPFLSGGHRRLRSTISSLYQRSVVIALARAYGARCLEERVDGRRFSNPRK